ncbi:MAG: DUF3330 domain-containing protein [Gammaproteobacteria bacterium]|nr:DUF3330 domain-containing protein [Gammaproteobacteria bacterium]
MATVTNNTSLRCDVCLKEIPASVGYNAEADEYVSHYFGLDCYQRWHQHQQLAGCAPGSQAANCSWDDETR